MKAAILENIEHLVVKEVPDPELKPGAIILRVRVCSICSTDLRIFRYGDQRVTLPQIIGHEIAGEVKSVSKDVSGYCVGERVAVTPRIACGKCYYCLKGQDIYCLHSQTLGYQLPGGYAEYLFIPPRGIEYGILHKIADNVSFEQASLAEPLSCCIRAQRNAHISPGDIVVIIGGGPIGIIHCRLAKLHGAGKVILVENAVSRLRNLDLTSVDNIIDSAKVDSVSRIDTLTKKNGADVVIVACSSRDAQEQAVSLAGKGGRINYFGGLPPHHLNISLDSNLIHYREISILGSHGSTPHDTKEAVDMLASKRIDITDLISQTFPLNAIADAFLFAESKAGMHVAIHP